MAQLEVSLVAMDRPVWSGAATLVVATTPEGEIGILSGHEPILAILAPGETRVTAADGSVVTARVEDGFLSVQGDTVTIVAGTAELV